MLRPRRKRLYNLLVCLAMLFMPLVSFGWAALQTTLNIGTGVSSSAIIAVTYDCSDGSQSSFNDFVEPTSNYNVSANTCGSRIVGGQSSSAYYQAGWALTSGGTAVSVLNLVEDVTLYPVWMGNQYTVSLDANGGTMSSGNNWMVITNGDGYYNATKNLTYGDVYGIMPTPTKTGYNFAGWYSGVAIGDISLPATSNTHNFSVLKYNVQPGATYKVTMDSATLTSGTATQFATVLYDFTIEEGLVYVDTNFGNNISYDVVVPSNLDATHQLQILIYAGMNGYTENNAVSYENVKISTFGSTAITQITAGSSVSTEGTHQLHAMWSPSEFTVNLDPATSEGRLSSSNGWEVSVNDDGFYSANKTLTYGSTYGTLPTPTRDNYNFLGWYTSLNIGNKTIAASTSNTNYTNIKYDVQPGMTYTITMSSATLTEGSATKFTTRVYDFSSSTTLAAVETNFGSNLNYTITVPTTADGTHKLRIIVYAGIPGETANNAVSFQGIKIGTMGTTTATQVTSNTTVSTAAPHQLYAVWERSNFNVTYNCNGGTGSNYTQVIAKNGNGAIATGNCGSKIVTGTGSGTSATPMVYYQSGWATTSGGSAQSTITITSDRTLYAVWAKAFTYSASYKVSSNDTYYQIDLLGSGNFVSNIANTVDLFAVGGGGGGGGASAGGENWRTGGGGGGGGYTTTKKSQNITANTTYTVTVGSGGTVSAGANGGRGGTSSFGSLISAAGGYGGKTTGVGGNGGSGGGSCKNWGGGNGGGNGANGTSVNSVTAGTGQGTTTALFGDTSTGTYYAPGGGGGGGRPGGSGGPSGSVGTPGLTGANSGAGGTGGNCGGGQYGEYAGAAGKTGIVVVRGLVSVNKYTLTYNNNGGSGCTTKEIIALRTLGTLCTPTKTNYRFVGWFTSLSGGTRVTSETVPTGNMTVYAQYLPEFTYTGTYEIDYDNVYIKFKTSGTYTPAIDAGVDFFLVGGGGGGGTDNGKSGGGGGGGGYTTISADHNLTANTAYTITVGSGGAAQSNGTASSIMQGSTTLATAAGGKGANKTVGGNGGSGGGTGGSAGSNGNCGSVPNGGGSGGVNGANGKKNANNVSNFGTGQSVTTCEFQKGTMGSSSCDSGAKLYASGGKGGSGNYNREDFNGNCSINDSASAGSSAAANTGNGGNGGNVGGTGGTGGSGIVILRTTQQIVYNNTVLGTYGGNYEVVNDGSGNYRVKFKTSGKFIPSTNLNVDIFLVGGGGGGGSTGSGNGNGGGGGGGGRTTTYSNYTLESGKTYNINIGLGGASATAGGTTSIVYNGNTITSAAGGNGGAGMTGGNGGSGGGSGGVSAGDVTHAEPTGSSCSLRAHAGGAGGTNGGAGSNNANGDSYRGTGQGTTTYEFGGSSGTLYSAGGAGGAGRYVWEDFNNHCSMCTSASIGTIGTENTGNGGGGGNVGGAGGNGGSGIIVIRNKR